LRLTLLDLGGGFADRFCMAKIHRGGIRYIIYSRNNITVDDDEIQTVAFQEGI
jgi:hypothetical protein